MSPTDPTAKPRPRRRSPVTGGINRSLTLVSAAVLLLVVAAVALQQGQISGVEFSPTHFAARSFRYYEIPGIQWQCTPIQRDDLTIDAARFLTQKKLVQTPGGKPTRWDLVRLTRGDKTLPDDASMLLELLTMPGRPGGVTPGRPGGGPNTQPHWQTWSTDHPASAAIVWPLVQTLAIEELYFFVPEVLQTAQRTSDRSGDDAAGLATELQTLLTGQYESLRRDLRQAGMTAAADSLDKIPVATPP